MEEMKVGSGGSGSEKREERESLSEGVGFYMSCALHSTWVDFFLLCFLLFFLYFGRSNKDFGIGMRKFCPVLHFRYFSSFSRIFPHLLSFF